MAWRFHSRNRPFAFVHLFVVALGVIKPGLRPQASANLGARDAMKVFVFDLLQYGKDLKHLTVDGKHLPFPMEKKHFEPAVAVKTYAEHLDAWV
jgi:hypothetical protein